ncbi:MAG: hypothetical protein FJW36_23075 [Acidobacteria bacterium]|nr:hypothetical protein [Acidobacteriota bacterium]
MATQPTARAHRGGAAHRPENSIEAFHGAVAANIQIIQTDPVLSNDHFLPLIQRKPMKVMLQAKMA